MGSDHVVSCETTTLIKIQKISITAKVPLHPNTVNTHPQLLPSEEFDLKYSSSFSLIAKWSLCPIWYVTMTPVFLFKSHNFCILDHKSCHQSL